MRSIASVKGLKHIVGLFFLFFFPSVYTARRNTNYQDNSWIMIRKDEARKGIELFFRCSELSRYLVHHVVGNEIYETKKTSCL